jgi:rhodanese-related sulfurtransferase
MKRTTTWWPVIRGAGCIVIISSLVGTAVNWGFLTDVLTARKTFNPEEKIARILQETGIGTISLAEAKQSHDAGSAVFVDSRTEEEYRAGHIAGAINIPLDQFESRGPQYLERLPVGRPLITYCGGSCETSTDLARALVDENFADVKVLLNGWQLWVDAGYGTEVEQ